MCLYHGDITTLEIDAIVNAARPSLLGGGGIDRAIHAKAGPQLVEECKGLNGCKHGETKVTKAYNLPCKFVLHTGISRFLSENINPTKSIELVGPNRDLHSEEEGIRLLVSCYQSCLEKIEELGIRRIAFPCIATGAYRFPARSGAHIALKSMRCWLEKRGNADKVDLIIFNVYFESDLRIYAQLMKKYFPIYKLFITFHPKFH